MTGAAEYAVPGATSAVARMGAKYSSIWNERNPPGSHLATNWFAEGQPYIAQCGSSVVVVLDLSTAYWFTATGNTYEPQFGSRSSLTFDAENCQFLFASDCGDVGYFTPQGSTIQFLRANSPDQGIDAEWRPDERLLQLSQAFPAQDRAAVMARGLPLDGMTITNTNSYEYNAADQLAAITYLRSINPVSGISRTTFCYYGENEEHGTAGDLKTSTDQLLIGTTWIDHKTHYFRYYRAGESGGFEHGLKYVLGSEAFERLRQDPQVADPFLATDTQVAQYADFFYVYDADQRVVQSTTQGGLLTYLFAYETRGSSSSGEIDPNEWVLKMTTTNPDSSQSIAFNNALGQTLLTDLASGSDHWLEYYQFDANFRQTLHAHPSAVVSYDAEEANLGVVLRSQAGLVEWTDYYPETTATPTEPGGAEGYIQSRSLSAGQAGDRVMQSAITYIQRVAGAATIYPVAESIQYRHDDGTGTITTRYAYTWFEDTAQMEQRTTTLPVVPMEQNGTGTTDTITEIFDEEGHLIWLRDARGFITFHTYDLPTRALIQQVQDVDGTKIELPPGWSTPAHGGLNLVTDYEVDALGRTTQILGPPRDVEGQTIRTAHWTVYRDREDEIVSGQGYALGAGPDRVGTLVNPVSIARTSPDGRVQDAITAVRGCAASRSCDSLVPEAGVVESPGRLSAGDCFPQSSWVRWSRTLSDNHGLTVASRVYHRIPAEGEGLVGTNYDETRYGYDLMARQNRVLDPTGTIDRTVFDVRGLTVSTWTGTDDRRATDADPTGGGAAGNNMVRITANAYDGGTDGGDGNLTEQTLDVDAVTTRVTTFAYDFRSRQIAIDGEEGFYQEQVYDNLNQMIQVDQRDGSSGGNLVARNATHFDDRGRVCQTLVDAVDPATGTVGNSLISNTWYDAAGHVLCSLPAGSQAFTKMTYDGIGRTIVSYTGYNPDDEITPASVEDDVLFEQTEVQYDAASHVLMTTNRQRWDAATGTGPLQGPAGEQPKSRDSYVAIWSDGVGRVVASADYGTHAEAGPPERSDRPPESSDTVLVSLTAYNARGEAFETTDPAGQVNRAVADDAGRTVRTIQNYGTASEPACFCPGAEENVVVEYAYGPGGLLASLTAVNAATGNQVTRYQYGATRSESDLASNRLLRAEVPPNAVDSSDRTSYAYNRQGQTRQMTDRNGSVHSYSFDGLGRPTSDTVTTLADGVDGSVRRIEQAYEVRGMVEKTTSYSDAAGTTVVNQVQNAYNDFAQLIVQYQEHDGAVDTGTSPAVQYGYANGSANTIRPVSMTYPNGRILEYEYSDEAADKLSRLDLFVVDAEDVAAFGYLGLGTFIRTDYLPPGVRYDLATGTGTNRYAGLDRFGRIIDLAWRKVATVSSSSSSSSSSDADALVHLQYGYDRASNRTYRRDAVARSYGKAFDELYEYDGLNQLKKFHRGLLDDDNRVITSPGLQQAWQFDATGNWKNFTQFDPVDTTKTLDQQRLHNRVNEITEIARTVGADWLTPTYDRNGNMTGDEKGQQYTYDAWNRLVRVEDDESNLLKAYAYDGQGWRVSEDDGVTMTELFYSAGWQVLEERVDGETMTQYVYSPRYIDELVLRDRATTTPGTLDEQLWVLQDANYNVVGLVDGTGVVVERYGYTPFGVSQVMDAICEIPAASDYEWVVRHQGLRLDLVTGNYYNRERVYRPEMGRFIQVDPIRFAAGVNWYAFEENSPLLHLDTHGLQSSDLGVKITPVVVRPSEGAKARKAWGAFMVSYRFQITGSARDKSGIIVQHITSKANIDGGVKGASILPVYFVDRRKRPHNDAYDVNNGDYWEAWSVTSDGRAYQLVESSNIWKPLSKSIVGMALFPDKGFKPSQGVVPPENAVLAVGHSGRCQHGSRNGK